MNIKRKISQLMMGSVRESLHNSSIRHNENRLRLQSSSCSIESDFLRKLSWRCNFGT